MREKSVDRPVQTGAPTAWLNDLFSWRRTWIIGLIGLVVFSLELYEHARITKFTPLAFVEFLVFSALLVSISVLTNRLSKTIKIQKRQTKLLEMKHRLSLQLAAAQKGNDLTQEILNFPASIIEEPVHTLLFVFDPESAEFELAGEFIPDDLKGNLRPSIDALQLCNTCLGAHQDHIHPLDVCELYHGDRFQAPRNGYCLPLTAGLELIGVLHVQLVSDQSLTKEQIESFNNVKDEIGIALRSALQQKQIAELNLAQAAIAERQEVFRDLHDVLGQNLATLQMKLDQYARRGDSLTTSLTDLELGPLRDLVTVSYEIVRESLNDLHSSTTPFLSSLLNHHSGLVVGINQFEYHFTETGEPRPLPPLIIHHTYFICKEAIHNIARHSGANIVEGKLMWGKHDLTIEIVDNGKGFDIETINQPGHYGLSIMQERVERIRGRFDIQSAIGVGTTLTIQIPLNGKKS